MVEEIINMLKIHITNTMEENVDISEISIIKEGLIKGMIDYIKEFGGEGYKKSDVKDVERILDKFEKKKNEIKKNNKNDYMEIVKSTVESLNELNDKCDGSLIETDQREDICQIIIQTALFYGYIDKEMDITEEWREW